MEPTIYKPSIYKGESIYKGAGGIYNGRGVYNFGISPYSGPFVILNNFENLDDNISVSEIGPNFNADSNSFRLENSSVFIGKKCLAKFSSDKVRAETIDNILMDNIFTCETYYSNLATLAYNQVLEVCFGEIFIEMWGAISKYRIEATQSNYILYNGATFHASGGGHNYYVMPISINNSCHVAIVVRGNEAYIFLNGTLYLKLTKPDNFINEFKGIFRNEEIATVNAAINFYCVRNGDFSNNLETFTVPTQKYIL